MESGSPKALEKILDATVRQVAECTQQLLDQPPFASVSALSNNKLSMINAFEDHQKASFDRLMKPIEREVRRGVIGEVQRSFENLRLVDKEELTLKLIGDHFLEQLDDGINTKMALLAMRFEYTCGQDLEIEDLPIGHILLAEHLLAAVKSVELEPGVRAAFYKNLLTTLADSYIDLVNIANNLFIDAGVLADLNDSDGQSRFKRNHQKIEAAKKRKALIASVSHEVKFDDDGNPIPPDMDEVLEHLQIPDTAKAHVIESDLMAPQIDDKSLLQTVDKLNDLHAPASADDDGYQTKHRDESLADQLANHVGLKDFSLDKKNANTISMMSMLFEDLFANTHFADPIKALLEQLQLPMLKTAIMDKNFFADSGNPAQTLLDKIAEQGAAWSPDKKPEKDFQYKSMASIIRELNAHFDGTYAVFSDAAFKLDSFNKKHQERTAKIETRIVSMEKARARHDRAKQESAAHIEQIFGRFQLPEPMQTFVDGAWQSVLFFIHNKYDNTDNHQWQTATMAELKLMKVLSGMQQDKKETIYDLQSQMLEVGQQKGDVNLALKHIIPHMQKTERATPKAPQPAVQPATSLINDPEPSSAGLPDPIVDIADIPPVPPQRPADISSASETAPSAVQSAIDKKLADQGSVSLFEDGLLDEPDTLANTPIIDSELPPAIDQPLSEDQPLLDTAADVLVHTEAELQALPSQLSIGSWLLDKRGDGEEKIKVAAYIKHTDNFILVKRNGTKAAAPTSADLLTWLKRGEVELIESALAFDRALESVITGLRA
ncbi:Uncharacterised protein [BD1-7 clade bacterium]|uniref:Thymidine phosphorylase n=1 Tax=BD1-7 clade bacterium TaxID=2029982 RepID=A0A5S9MRT5_9GAMM|nr:Uncharacterised protein [BD1-7 clade bacterium]